MIQTSSLTFLTTTIKINLKSLHHWYLGQMGRDTLKAIFCDIMGSISSGLRLQTHTVEATDECENYTNELLLMTFYKI